MMPALPTMRWLFASPPDRRLLPSGRFAGATPWLIGIMMFVMMIVAATGLALAGGARLVREGIAHRYSIQIADGRSSEAVAVAAARAAPGVVRAVPVPETELRATLEQWLGPVAAGEGGDLPLPALIDVELRPGTDPALVAAAVKRAVPSAQFIADQSRLAPMLDTLTALTIVAALLVALIALATAAAVVLATRGALDTHRGTIEVMHGIGATDLQVTRLFQRKIAIDALIGGTAGGIVAALVLLLVAGAGFGALGDWTNGSLLRAIDLVLLASLPLLAAILATVVARTTVLAALRAQL
jgi:cell division transport system permease protein